MYSKKILSTVAAVAVLSTGLMAFDTDENQKILSEGGKPAGYFGGISATNDLNLSTNLLGDTLIYPYYSMKDGWVTEIVVRNTTPRATVAKVGLYKGEDSQELVDFNIYLSPFDVARFEIRDGNIFTSDGSIAMAKNDDLGMKGQTNPKHGSKNDNAYFLDSENTKSYPILGSEAEGILATQKGANQGYVIIYGMTQYQDGGKREQDSSDWPLSYHDNDNSAESHLNLWKDYRRLLDNCRDGWRDAFKGGMQQGVMTVSVAAPDTNIGRECAEKEVSVAGYDLKDFGDVAHDTLTGTVRIFKEDGSQSRDLLLPATALSNFTDKNMMIWAEGEYAALQDRRIIAGSNDISKYDEVAIRKDAEAFLIKRSYYTFSKDSKANQLIVTQPMKRVLTQFGLGLSDKADLDGYWYNRNQINSFGGFSLKNSLFDEDEVIDGEGINISSGTFTSPYSSSADEVITFNDEVQIIKGMEIEAGGTDPIEDGYGTNHDGIATSNYFRETIGNGFVYLTFNGNDSGLPAIVTQMTGSKVGGIAQTNWIYAPVISNNED